MSHYILVHGAWEESGMWDRVSPILQRSGHIVTAVDLPGHGANKQEGLQVTTELYIEALVETPLGIQERQSCRSRIVRQPDNSTRS